MRKNVQIMFIGMSAEDSSAIIRLLRASRLAPRGHLVTSEDEFVESLRERSWDVILCTTELEGFSSRQAMHVLQRLDKDIPIVQLVPNNNSHYLLNGLKNNLQAVVPMDEPELLVIQMRRELERLDQRRQLRQLQASLTDAERQYDALLDSSSIPIAFLQPKSGKVIYANSGLAELLGYPSGDKFTDTPLKQYIGTSEHSALNDAVRKAVSDHVLQQKISCQALRADDSELAADLAFKRTRHKGTDCLQVTFTPRLEAQETIQEANTDLVSGVYNSSYFGEVLEDTLNRALAGGADCNLLYINLDNFLDIRTDAGIEGCDQIIRDIANLLKKHVNQVHFIARVEEDSFVVIFQDPSPDKALSLADKLCKAIEGNISEIAGKTIRSTASIGVATISDNTPTRLALLERVRLAADDVRANNQLGNGFQLYQHQATEEEEENDQISLIERAVNENSMRLLFQPIVSLNQASEEHHYEAFLRLLDEDNKEVSPNDFLQALEESDVSIRVDRWVIKEAMMHMQRELKQGSHTRVFISLSCRTLRDRKTLIWLAELMRMAGIPGHYLVIQISEADASSYLKHAAHFAETLHKLHIKVCLKHYGCSPNSESILKQINPDYVKLDGVLIQDINDGNTDDKEVIQWVHSLKAQKRVTIAPQVEGTRVMGTLWKAGVHFVQGHYLQAPTYEMNYDFFDQ